MLGKFLKPGSRVYTVLRHVSSSGMSRRIDLYCHVRGKRVKDDYLQYLTGYFCVLAGYPRPPSGKQGVMVQGCGMDMGFHVVYTLGRYMWPKGFKLPKGERGRNGDTSGSDTDGGYALSHSWL